MLHHCVRQLRELDAHVHQADTRHDMSGDVDSLQLYRSDNFASTHATSNNCDDLSAGNVEISYEYLEQGHDCAHEQPDVHPQDSEFLGVYGKGRLWYAQVASIE